MTIPRARLRVAVLALGLVAAPAAGHAAEYVLNAFAPLVVVGDHDVVNAEGEATVKGTVEGPLHVEREDGTQVEDGTVSCEFTLVVDTVSVTEEGTGTCTITFKDGAKIMADTACKGVPGVGCDGPFTVTGGTGRFEGASGEGPVRFQTRSKGYRMGPGGSLTQIVFGVAYWDDYVFEIN